MRNKNNGTEECRKHIYSKCRGVCKTYSLLQSAYAEILENDPQVKSFICNQPMEGTSYTTDFVITKTDGSVMVRECIMKRDLVKPRWLGLLDLSRNYWTEKNIPDWGLVADKQK